MTELTLNQKLDLWKSQAGYAVWTNRKTTTYDVLLERAVDVGLGLGDAVDIIREHVAANSALIIELDEAHQLIRTFMNQVDAAIKTIDQYETEHAS